MTAPSQDEAILATVEHPHGQQLDADFDQDVVVTSWKHHQPLSGKTGGFQDPSLTGFTSGTASRALAPISTTAERLDSRNPHTPATPGPSLLQPNMGEVAVDIGAITTTRTVTTTRTTTTIISYPPVVFQPPPEHVQKDPKNYPLSTLRLPKSWKSFEVTLGGKQVHCEESQDGKLNARVTLVQQGDHVDQSSHKRPAPGQSNSLRRLANRNRMLPGRIDTERDREVPQHNRKRKRMEGWSSQPTLSSTPGPSRLPQLLSTPESVKASSLNTLKTTKPFMSTHSALNTQSGAGRIHLRRVNHSNVPQKRRSSNSEDQASSSDEADSLPGEASASVQQSSSRSAFPTDSKKLPPSPIYSPAESLSAHAGVQSGAFESHGSRLALDDEYDLPGSLREGRAAPQDYSAVVPLATLRQLPNMLSHYDSLPTSLQSYMLLQLLRRSPAPTLQFVSSVVLPALKRDFLSLLPAEISLSVMDYLDVRSLSRCAQVSRKWRGLVDADTGLWRRRGVRDGFWDDNSSSPTSDADGLGILHTRQDRECDESMIDSATVSPLNTNFKNLTKEIYRRHYVIRKNWYRGRHRQTTFAGHDSNVVTCLQFDSEKIVSGSDDHTIHIYNIKTTELIRILEGHGGGVWGLQYVGDTLVSGSTDRTVRVWDMSDGRCTHILGGHTSTVRCLQIIQPMDARTAAIAERASNNFVKQPPYPLIVTGSRDTTLRVWRLPNPKTDPHYHSPDEVEGAPAGTATGTNPGPNPFFLHTLRGHTHSVRAVAGHGTILCSGSYDATVRVWDIVKGECVWRLQGHTQKVYSIVFDGHTRCWSGSMDSTLRCWDITNGTCIAALEGHTSLVGLLQYTPSHLISAAADSTLRVWDPNTNQLSHTLSAHTGAITCFQHDRYKVVSGSEGTIKLWDLKSGLVVRDLVSDLSGVWLLRIDTRYCVAAVTRNNRTEFVVLDFDVPDDTASAYGDEQHQAQHNRRERPGSRMDTSPAEEEDGGGPGGITSGLGPLRGIMSSSSIPTSHPGARSYAVSRGLACQVSADTSRSSSLTMSRAQSQSEGHVRSQVLHGRLDNSVEYEDMEEDDDEDEDEEDEDEGEGPRQHDDLLEQALVADNEDDDVMVS